MLPDADVQRDGALHRLDDVAEGDLLGGTRASLPSLEVFGSSSNPGSSHTQRCRSVNRTPSGSTSGCASASASAMSSESSQVSRIFTAPRGAGWRAPPAANGP